MTPEQEEEVRRALADAASDRTPLPPDLADRLDDVLADLVATRQREPFGEEPGATDSRGVRRWPLVLTAAAVVCLGALGGLAVMRAVTSGDTRATSSASGPATVVDGGGPADQTASGAPEGPSAGSSRRLAEGVLPPPQLHRATLQQDVRRVVAAVPLSESGRTGRAARPDSTTVCPTPSRGRDTEVVAVRLDGKPATLVLEAPRNGTREALVYACQDVSAPVATTRVRAP
jgi:hypothetical protein